MSKIVVKHSCVEIHNYDLGDCPELEYIFSVWDPVYFRRKPKGMEYNADERILYLPRGLDISYLENIFSEDAFIDKNHDPYATHKPIGLKYLPKDDRQKQILRFLTGTGDYYYTKAKSQLSCYSTTGSGKTYTTIAAICATGSRGLIISNMSKLLDQWRDKIKEYTPLQDSEIYTITGSETIGKLFTRNPMMYKIFLASHDTIKSYADKYGWDSINRLFKHLKIGIKVYDEAHLYFDNIASIDFHTNTKKTLYLTATPQRSDADENAIYQLYFKNVPSIELYDPDSDPHTDYIALHFNSHPSPYDISNCKNKFGFDRNKYTNYVVERENFILLLINIVEIILRKPGKALIYVGTNDAIALVYNTIIAEFPFLEGNIGIYTSVVDKSIKDAQLNNKIILSTTKSCGAAMDISDLKITINLAEPFKTAVLAKQTLGRTRADNTTYFDVVDQGFYFTKKYYQQKKPVFAQYAKSFKDVKMDDVSIENKALEIKDKYDSYTVMCMEDFT